MSDHEVLASELEHAVSHYLEKHKGKSLATLAKAAGVGYTTVRRLAQGEAVPNQETTLSIIDVVLSPKDKIDFLKRHYPKIGKLVEEAYADKIEDNPLEHEMLKYFCSLETHNFVFNIAATSHGTSFEQIKRLMGQKGILACEEMLEWGLLVETNDDRIVFDNETWAITNVVDLLQQIKHSISYFNRSLVGGDGAHLMHVTASVNRETLAEISQLAKEFMVKIIKIKDDPKAKGDIPFFADFLMNMYDHYNLERK